METNSAPRGGNRVERLSGEGPRLDAVRVERLRENVRRAAANGAEVIVVDLASVEQLDYMGLAGLVLLPSDTPRGVLVALASLQPAVRRTVLLVHLHEVFDLYEDASSAVRVFTERLGCMVSTGKTVSE